jgi:hypothetical protein
MSHRLELEHPESPHRPLSPNSCHSTIMRNVNRLGRLADRCHQINSRLCHVEAESHRILDHTFLAPQPHNIDYMVNLNYRAFLDIELAMVTYTEYVAVLEELMEAHLLIQEDIILRLDSITDMCKRVFRKVRRTALRMTSSKKASPRSLTRR